METRDPKLHRIAGTLTAVALFLEALDKNDIALIASVCCLVIGIDSTLLTKVTITEFWNTRIAVSDIPQSSSRIPHLPDQIDFLSQWFDWHRGYRILILSDGSEQHEELKGEPLSEVSLGHLPRTLEQSQSPQAPSGHQVSSLSSSSHLILNHRHNSSNQETRENVTRLSMNPSLTPFIDPEDRIFDSSSSSESSSNSDSGGHQDTVAGQQDLVLNLQRNVAALNASFTNFAQSSALRHAELSNVSNQITSIRRQLASIWQPDPIHLEDNSTSPAMNTSSRNTPDPLTGSGRQNDHQNITSVSAEALRPGIDYLSPEEFSALVQDEYDPNDSDFARMYAANVNRITAARRRVEQERRREGLAPVFGTREEVERQGADYQSPLSHLFHQQPPTQMNTPESVSRHSDFFAAATQQMQRTSNWLETTSPPPQGESFASNGGVAPHQRGHGDPARPGSYSS